MRVTKYEYAIGLALVVITGCASGGKDDAELGSGGSAAPNFSNVAGQGSPQSMAGAPAPAAGSGGTTGKPSGTGGSAQPQAGKGGSSGTGTAGMGAAGMGTAGGSGAAGMGTGGSSGSAGMDDSGTGGDPAEEDPFAGLLPTDDPNAGNNPPPAAGMCADAVCFDVFDCYLWHADIVDCGFTDCVDFICK